MGPVLLKPLSQTGAQVVVLGRAVGVREARDYFQDTGPLSRTSPWQALDRLARHPVIVLEGAGARWSST